MGPVEYLVARCEHPARRMADRAGLAMAMAERRVATLGRSLARMRRLISSRLTLPWAIVISAALVAGALLIAPLVAPYRFQGALLGGFWQFNSVTGEARMCLSQTSPFLLICSETYRPELQTPAKLQ